MFWIALLLLGLAIALWRYGHYQADEVIRFLGFSSALICLMAGITAAPWPMKVVLFTGLIVYPTCAPTERTLKHDCPRFCLLRNDCQLRR